MSTKRIFKLTLDVKNPDIPFRVIHSVSSESGDLVKVFAHFQLELVRLLRQLKEEDERNKVDDEIPF